ncbi:MAG: universal stress protein [Dehalococcoidia bacterium]|jgi:nucleotide-binding universal stress UspA family protein|nr:universal stress protein [Dehalococcoidia bacterium]
MYAKILVTLDGSEFALDALAEVARLAGPESTVELVEVVDSVGQIVARTTSTGLGFDGADAGLATADQAIAAQRDAAYEELRAVAARLATTGVALVNCNVLEGQAGPAIVEFAESAGVDVVVIATHGRSGMVRAVFGSVSDYVARHARPPVMLVSPAAGPLPDETGEHVREEAPDEVTS